jgi:hypothetical protein
MSTRGWLQDMICWIWRRSRSDFGLVWIGRRCGIRMRSMRSQVGFAILEYNFKVVSSAHHSFV